MLNKGQVVSVVSVLVAALGGWLVAKGLVTQDIVDRLSDVNTVGQVVGAVMAVAAVVSGIVRRTDSAIVDSAAKVKGVAQVQVTDPKLEQKTTAPNVRVVSTL